MLSNAALGEINYGIITARARRYDAMGCGYVSEEQKAIGEEMGLRALATRLKLEPVDDVKTVVSADLTLLEWYVDTEQQIPQGVLDVVAAERRRLGYPYCDAAIATMGGE